MEKAWSGRNLDANLEMTLILEINVVPYLFVQALHMPRSKNSSGVHRPKYKKKMPFSLVSPSVRPSSRRCAERIQQREGRWSRAPKAAID